MYLLVAAGMSLSLINLFSRELLLYCKYEDFFIFLSVDQYLQTAKDKHGYNVEQVRFVYVECFWYFGVNVLSTTWYKVFWLPVVLLTSGVCIAKVFVAKLLFYVSLDQLERLNDRHSII